MCIFLLLQASQATHQIACRSVLALREAIRYRTGGFFALDTTPPIAISVTNTSLCTILIAARIWFLRRRIRKLVGSAGVSLGQGLMGGVLWLIETGALFTSTQVRLCRNYKASERRMLIQFTVALGTDIQAVEEQRCILRSNEHRDTVDGEILIEQTDRGVLTRSPPQGLLPTLLVVLVYLRKLERPMGAQVDLGYDHERTNTTLRFKSRDPKDKSNFGPGLNVHDHNYDGSSSITRIQSE